jgi:hypothetical protein
MTAMKAAASPTIAEAPKNARNFRKGRVDMGSIFLGIFLVRGRL